MAKAKSKSIKKTVNKKTVNVSSLVAEFNNFKVNQLHRMSEMESEVREVRKEATTMSRIFGALLDLVSDISSIPNKVISERFMFYCGERHPVDSEGKVKGNIKVVGYNLELEGYDNEGCIV